MSKDKALKLALEALETGLCYVENEDFDNKQKFRGYEHLMPTDAAESIQEIKTAIAAVKEALAQPEQEPVAWMRDDEMKAMVSDEKRAWILCGRSELIEEYNKPLYTTPPQPEQEPVAWLDEYGNAFPLAAKQYSVVGKHWKPLYTTPPQRTWVGLTDEEMHECWDSPLTPLGMKHARMIEAKFKQKNGYAEEKNT